MLKSIIDVLQANAVLLALLVGSVTPLLVSLVQQPKWSKKIRIGVSVVVSVVVGFALAAADGKLDPGNLFSVVIAVLVAAEAFYQKLWKVTGVAAALEQATSPRSFWGPPASDKPYSTTLDPKWEPEEYQSDPGPLETK